MVLKTDSRHLCDTLLRLRSIVEKRHFAQIESILHRTFPGEVKFGMISEVCVPLEKNGMLTPCKERYSNILSICNEQERKELIRDREALDYYSRLMTQY